MKYHLSFFLLLFTEIATTAQPVATVPPLPTKSQLAWHEMEFYLFMHFGPNTFTDKEWGHGDEPEDIFNPTALDCRQWARIARDAGAKGIIITAKHHDGFCLWPSAFSTHTVRESKWRNGKGDVLSDLSKACKEYGIKFGIYISPWDRNHPQYGTPGYNEVYVKTMAEATRKYGPIFEMWWDGANGEGPNGRKQVYDFRRFEKVIRKVAPQAVVFSDIGPDIRWVGNENGIASETNWNLLDTAGFTRGAGGPPQDSLGTGNVYGKNWIPAECDVSIRPGWFYHANEDDKVKTSRQLMQLYLKSVGRGSNLLLNVPPDRRGLIHPNDSAALMNFKKEREAFLQKDLALHARVMVSNVGSGYSPAKLTDGQGTTYWMSRKGSDTCTIQLDLDQPKSFNTISIEEAIEFGQKVAGFSVEVWNGDKFIEVAKSTTIGRKRILQFPEQTSAKLRLRITRGKGNPVLRDIKLYHSTVY